MITMDGALDDYFEEKIASTLEDLMSEANIDEEGQAFINKLKKALEIIAKLNDENVPPKERCIMTLQLEAIQLAMLDYSLKDRRKRISPDDLPKKLEETGLLCTYEKWNRELLDSGFIMREVVEEEFVNKRELIYSYRGDFSIYDPFDGNDDFPFYLRARLAEKGLFVEFDHYNLRVYLGYSEEAEVFQGEKKATERIPKVQKFLDKNRELTSDYGERVKVDSTGLLKIWLDNDSCVDVKVAKGIFIKFAVLIEKEMRRVFPFETINGYEFYSKAIVDETISAFKSYEKRAAWRYLNDPRRCVNEGRSYFLFENRIQSIRCLRDAVIRSSYGTTRDETIKNIHEAAKNVFSNSDIEECIEQIGRMSSEEFENYKDQLFDL